jgi:hypothetical protein
MPTLVPPRAFISYRTEDSQAVATTLERELKRILAWGEVFLDHRSLDTGESWPKRLRAEVQRADVVLLLIGPRWLTLQAPDGIRKLDDPDDWAARSTSASAAAARRSISPRSVERSWIYRSPRRPTCATSVCARCCRDSSTTTILAPV